MKVTIIGLGLIGGSMAIQLKKTGFASHVFGVDNHVLHAETALRLGLVDELIDLEDGIQQADLIILAIPAQATMFLLPQILDRVNQQVVTDVCSIKEKVCLSVENHPKRKQYVAAHPMAGTENSGPWAAMEGLFDGKVTILSDVEKSDLKAVEMVKQMYTDLNMRLSTMNSVAHDLHAAYVSHISHISSFALALTVLNKEKNESNIFDLASGGFDSTVRLAKSSPEMWTPIFVNNSDNVLEVLNDYIERLQEFKSAIETKNQDELDTLMKTANRIKRILK